MLICNFLGDNGIQVKEEYVDPVKHEDASSDDDDDKLVIKDELSSQVYVYFLYYVLGGQF